MSERPVKRILYCGAEPAGFRQLVEDMTDPPPVRADTDEGALRFGHPRAELVWVPAYSVEQALGTLATRYLNLVVVDLRAGDDRQDLMWREQQLRRFLEALDDVEDLETRYGFHRILVMVSGTDEERVDHMLVELGGYGIRHVMNQRDESDRMFAVRVLEEGVRLMLDRQASKTALCAAGGGITAIFFELGALKCLDDCLSPGALHDFDMYFGISAGAVVTSILANGYSPDEVMAALAGHPGGRISSLDLSLVRLGHLNVPDFRRRMRYLTGRTAKTLWGMARGKPGPTVDGVFLELTALVGAPFRSDRFEEMLRAILTAPGATNDFRELAQALYVGSSNQDARRHVLFGEELPHVPISKAVQASLSINPAFSAVEIEGTWYEDGAVTRTSNFVEAIKRGANLVLVLDPFVPYVSKEPGFANRRGMLFNIDQDVRSMSFTRYENARNWALRRYPEVSSYTFLPNNRLRKALSVNPMDHRVYMEIFRGSYLGTLNRLEQIQHRLAGDLAVHGIALDLSKARAIAERLEANEKPAFADFFVDGRVDIRRPPLTHERKRAQALAS